MIPIPYIGITGIVTQGDVETVRECATLVRTHVPTHRLMAGVLMSYKTLTGQTTTNRRYPLRTHVETSLKACLDAGAWPVIHYNTHAKGADFARELEILSKDFPTMAGIQLNVVCPDREAISSFVSDPHRGVEVILQVNGTSLRKTEWNACSYIGWYDDISHALLDASGGNGKLFSPGTAEVIAETYPHAVEDGVRLGLAGGLGPDCGPALENLQELLVPHGISLRDLSFDAESRVRVPVSDPIPGEKYQDTLSHTASLMYVRAVIKALKFGT